MKTLLAPAFAVVCSTLGTAWGCHAFGMPPAEVKLATALAFAVASATAFGAVWLSARPRRSRRQRPA